MSKKTAGLRTRFSSASRPGIADESSREVAEGRLCVRDAGHLLPRAFSVGGGSLWRAAFSCALAVLVASASVAAGGAENEGAAAAVSGPSGPITASVVGQTRLWTVRRPVAETDRDEIFQTERYGRQFSYLLANVPAGPCTLRLGFCENKYTRPGERVFDIAVNGKVIWPRFDILRHGMPDEAVIISREIMVPEDGRVEIAFRAYVDNAKINLVRLCGAGWVAETSPKDEQQVRFLQPRGDEAWLLDLHETTIGRFGSRFAINPRPQKGVLVGGPLGHADYNVAYFEKNPQRYDDPPANYYFTVAAGGRQYGFPFNPHVPVFPDIRQHQGMTWLEYTASSPDLPVRMTLRFEAPFYPQDLKLSCAPYIWVRARLENLTARRVTARLVMAREQRPQDDVSGAKLSAWRGLCFTAPVFGLPTQWFWLARPEKRSGLSISFSAHLGGLQQTHNGRDFSRDPDGRIIIPIVWQRPIAGLEARVQLEPFAAREVEMLWVAWVPGPVVEVTHQPHRFVYTKLFRSPEDVVNYAVGKRADIEQRVALFESSVFDATLPEALKELLAFAFQSWVMNTWYLCDGGGREWFSVWEGCCKFHSTVDVEYNVAPLYFMYWPKLMAMELREWSQRIDQGILPHDMGMGLKANGMEYGHQMEVEENTNFVLLLHQYWKYTGDDGIVRELMESAGELLAHVIECDIDGDGFVERGTYNTIDQGSEAVQSAPDQIYLAVRSMAAFTAGAEMARLLGRNDDADRWLERAALIARTLDSEGWLDDHYVVDLNQPAGMSVAGRSGGNRGASEATASREGVAPSGERPAATGAPGAVGPGGPGLGGVGAEGYAAMGPMETGGLGGQGYAEPWNNYMAPSGPPKGWDGYSVYTTNGLLYPLRSGTRIAGLNLKRLREDLGRAAAATLRMYGSPHTSSENNMWVSQNIWRDAAAAYFGIDMIDNVERYWAMQLYVNREKRGCFTDVYNCGSGSISLDYYPRGVAAFALVYALGGVAIDVPAGRVSVAALRSPLRLPLATLADWRAMRLPWLVLERDGLDTRAKIDGATAVPVTLTARPFGQPW